MILVKTVFWKEYRLKIALLADIHGNRWALEAVLDHMAQNGVERWANLGDIFYGPLDPAGTFQILKDMNIPTVSGNQDRILLNPGELENNQTFQFSSTSLGTKGIDWLRALPDTMLFDDWLLLCHGTPVSDSEYLLEKVTASGCISRPEEEVRALVSDPKAAVVACGHSHQPRELQLKDGLIAINPGSVGLPAYEDDLPYPHKMEAGSCHARYAVLSRENGIYEVVFHKVKYDVDSAIQAALQNERPDWAGWLENGLAQ